jgi:hypothetical protein
MNADGPKALLAQLLKENLLPDDLREAAIVAGESLDELDTPREKIEALNLAQAQFARAFLHQVAEQLSPTAKWQIAFAAAAVKMLEISGVEVTWQDLVFVLCDHDEDKVFNLCNSLTLLMYAASGHPMLAPSPTADLDEMDTDGLTPN